MASQLEMVNALLSDAEAVCTGRAHMTKEYNPEPGDSWETTLAGRVHHKALMEAVLQYHKTVTIPNQMRAMGETGTVPDAILHRIAVALRDKVLVDKLLAENP